MQDATKQSIILFIKMIFFHSRAVKSEHLKIHGASGGKEKIPQSFVKYLFGQAV